NRPDAAARDLPPASMWSGLTCTLFFLVTTMTFNGSYSPRYIGAIWVSVGSGRFVMCMPVFVRFRIVLFVTCDVMSAVHMVAAVQRAKLAHPTMVDSFDSVGAAHMVAIHEGASGGGSAGEAGCGCN